MIEKAGYWSCMAYTYVTTLYFVVIGAIACYAANNITDITVSSSPTNLQVIPDWQTVPFVDIKVIEAGSGCGEGWEPVFSRQWFGINAACDCLDACDPYSDPSTCKKFNNYEKCAATQIQAGCKQVEAWPMMNQNIMRGANGAQVLVCGQTGGLPFQDVIRPMNAAGDCPENYQKCNSNTVPDNTICYPPSSIEDSCPITDIKMIETKASELYVDLGYALAEFNETASVAFSKNTDSLPPTSIVLETSLPCISPYEQAESDGQQFYKAEMVKGNCSKDKFLGTSQDLRYASTGMYTNLYEVQTNNNVQKILEGSVDFDQYVSPKDVNKASLISSWNRPTINWLLSCDLEGKTRTDGLQAMATPSISSQIDTEWFHRFGMGICIAYSCWIALSILVHLCIMKQEVKDKFRIMTLLLYYPGRAGFLVWGPWLGARAGESANSADENLALLNNLQLVNNCMDDLQQYDTEAIRTELEQSQNEMSTMYVSFWVMMGLFVAEFMFWIVYAVHTCMNNVSRDHLARNQSFNNDKSVTTVLVDQGQPPMVPQQQQQFYQQPGLQGGIQSGGMPMYQQQMQYQQPPQMQQDYQQPLVSGQPVNPDAPPIKQQ